MFGFFSEVVKKAPKSSAGKRNSVPSELLGKLGCDACPRSASARRMRSPKMEGQGRGSNRLYVLTSGPSEEDDSAGAWLSDKAGAEAAHKLKRLMREARVNGVLGCWDPKDTTAHVATSCCKPRVIADIEQARPEIVVTLGDAALHWATGFPSALPWRGSLMPARFGTHVCWVFPMLWPNYVYKKGRSEYETAALYDAKLLEELLDSGLPKAQVVSAESVFEGVVSIIPDHHTPQESFKQLEHELERLRKEPEVGLDIETNALRPWRGDPHIWTAAVSSGDRTVAFPLDFPDTWVTDKWRRKTWDLFGDFLMSSGRKVCHNLAMEASWLSYFYGKGVLRGTEWEDTMAAAHTFDERPGTKSLDAQTILNFGFSLKAQSNIDTKRIVTYPLAKVLRYNGGDAKWTRNLWREQRGGILSSPKLRDEYERKLRLVPTLVATEHRGLRADLDYAAELHSSWTAASQKTRARISRLPEVHKFEARFRERFDPGNPDQVLRLMRDVLKRPEVVVEERGVTRQTTDEDALSAIPATEVPSAPLILELRGAEKLLSTYITPLLHGEMLSAGKKIRSQYGCMVAVTGRLNSEDPNVQNFPKRKHKEVRGVVAAHEGCLLMPCDYGQLEFRVAGMCSEDDRLVQYCWTGYDVHKDWAERIVRAYPRVKDWIVSEFGVDWDEKGLKTLRQEAKNKWVFPSIFGASVRSRSANLHLPGEVGGELDAAFWDEFPGVKRWQKKIVAHYEKHLYVETLGGRKRRGPMSLNEIINTPIQGTGADIVTAAMVALSEQAEAEDWPDIDPVINVHDDLTFEPRIEHLERTQARVVSEMTKPRADWVIVPLVVEVSVGARWNECKEVLVARGDEIHGLRNPYV